MADSSFDVVIVGGGNKSLVTAMYLTKYGGLSVGIFEDRHELGGGWSSEEPAPGFMANTCSHFHCGNYHIPVYQDIPEWESYGARYGHTKVSMGIVFEEDDSCLNIYSPFKGIDPGQEKTAKEIARFSEKDADTWLMLWDKCEKYWRPAMDEWMYTPAQPFGVVDAFDRLIQNPESGIDPIWLFQSPMQTYKQVFESVELQHAFARCMQSVGYQWDQTGVGISLTFLLYGFLLGNYVIGGTHQLAHASQRVVLENGGKVYTKYPVEKIIIENGNARGIRLKDGTEIEAKKAVVSTVDPYQLCFDLIGKDYLSPALLKKVANIERHWVTITWYTWVFKERPIYKAEAFNPDIAVNQWLALGDKDLDTFVMESYERKMKKWPSKTNLIISYHGGTPDDLIAPPGKGDFTVLSEQFVPPADAMPEEEWKKWEKIHADDVIKTWNKYAPNITWDNVVAYNPVTPYYTAKMAKNYGPAGNWAVIDNTPSQSGRLRPIPELAGHRVPIKGLYATGSAWHPYAGGHSMQGYNCYKVMAEDLGLRKPWVEKGRPY